MFIGGQWRAPTSDRRIAAIGANDELVCGSVPEAQEEDVDAAVSAAREAVRDRAGWTHWPGAKRATYLARLADILDGRSEELISHVSIQNGMPVSVARQLEASYPVVLLRYYADLTREEAPLERRRGLFCPEILVRREPVGVVAAIVPWNFPQTLAAFKYAPALAAGCTVVIKPSPETVLDAYAFAEAVAQAAFPPGVINVVPAQREVASYLAAHPDVDKVAFTGSTPAGRTIGEVCGRLLRPATLELGGKSAAIVLGDAELDMQTLGPQLFSATLLNNGQTCFLGTRILALQNRYIEIGPMATAQQRHRVESYIAKGRSEGARVTVGGGRPSGFDRGWFVEPTVFADVDSHHTIAQEEIFGPVLSVIPYTDDNDAIRIANDCDYGLGGTVWTTDQDRGLSVAQQIQTGTIGINTYIPDPVAPFGGVKASGLGRELGPEALASYQQVQSIYLG
ncbi:MAG TPA: aldehyde dehydrogenase [Mycobacterium sp.]